jgi:hypothetical protein
MKVKVFTCAHTSLESQITKWLRDLDKPEIIKTDLSHVADGFICYVVFYK